MVGSLVHRIGESGYLKGMGTLEIGQTYISDDGNSVYVSVGEDALVSWSSTLGWVKEEPKEGLTLIHDLPTGSITRTWCTTSGVWDDLMSRFIEPSKYRDTTKRIYKNKRNGGSPLDGSVEDPMETWLMIRLHKMSIKIVGNDS